MFSSIITIIVVIALIILSVVFLKQFFKVIAGLWSVLFIVLIVLSVLLYFDVKDLQANFDKGEKVVLLKENGNILTGFRLLENQKTTFYKDISDADNAFKAKNYASLKGNAYKLLIAQKDLFSDVDFITVIGYPLDRATLFSYLNDDAPKEKAAEFISKENAVPKNLVTKEIEKEFSTEDQFKGYLFAKLMGRTLEKKGANFIIQEYKKGTIEVYPETIAFKMIDYLPQSLFDKLFGEKA